MFLAKDKLNVIKVSISKALIDSYISHDDFFSLNFFSQRFIENFKQNRKQTNEK